MGFLSCRDTKIGLGLRTNPSLLFALCFAGCLALAADLTIVATMRTEFIAPVLAAYWRAAVCCLWLLVAIGLVTEAGASPDTLGLSLRAAPNAGFWVRAVFAMAAIVGLAAGGCAVAYRWHYGVWPPLPQQPGGPWGEWLFWMCVYAPLWEEIIYRHAVCTCLAPLVGAMLTILLDGALFAALHFMYGNPSPENFIGGYILAWAYLKSGSLWVPMALHSGGNFIVFLFNVEMR